MLEALLKGDVSTKVESCNVYFYDNSSSTSTIKAEVNNRKNQRIREKD